MALSPDLTFCCPSMIPTGYQVSDLYLLHVMKSECIWRAETYSCYSRSPGYYIYQDVDYISTANGNVVSDVFGNTSMLSARSLFISYHDCLLMRAERMSKCPGSPIGVSLCPTAFRLQLRHRQLLAETVLSFPATEMLLDWCKSKELVGTFCAL